jgi:hypothetical protein
MQQDAQYMFFDIEVFKYNAMVVFKDENKQLLKVFHNDFKGLADFIEDKVLVGFNNYHYDDFILHAMIDQKSNKQIKDLNDRIISGESIRLKYRKFESLDTYQQLDVSNPSLKKIEGNMGRMILESSVPFSLDRELTEEEYYQVLKYCCYDVDMVVEIFKMRMKSYFKPKFFLVDMYGEEKAIRWNTTTISGNLLLKKKAQKWSNIRVEEEFLEMVPPDVKEMWLERAQDFSKKKANKVITINEFGNEIQFGFGGLHGAHKEIKKRKNVKLLDVKSMYPNIILILNILGEASQKYKSILDRRLAIKHVDKILSEALKLILNSVYGNLNNEYSLLYNPNGALSVCVYGQIALYELCKRIAPYSTILNINTDGVAFIPHDNAYIEIYKQWEKDFSLQLEEKDFDYIYQKDVNNYIAIKGDYIECKGGDVNRYLEDSLFRNNNARIVDIALVDNLIKGKDILETITENLDKPQLFQYVLVAGGTYQGTFDEKGNKYNKVNRIFASKKEGFCIYKKRHDNGLVRFADAPINQFLWNQDCDELDDFSKIVDITHYYQLVIKKLERWLA